MFSFFLIYGFTIINNHSTNILVFILQWFVIKLFKLSGNFAIVPQFRDDLFIFISVGIDCEPFNKCI